ncbi:unnamed protein product [Cuscuta campestris]|uniref:F-box domain-containing protein n=1 Tax=Cuscuta campestris TaxID=132261 RepID=A0A484NB62_9ASTE|nr:unnamed protein product [Cuscuta campestris]
MDEAPQTDKYEKLCEGWASSCSTQLCDLPDGVLIHILSFLGLKKAVTTTVLSKRWKSLWAFIPNLAVSQCDFPERPLFLDFVGRAFALRDGSSLKTFSLSCDILEDAPLIIEWVSFAFMHNVKVLNLYLEKPGSPYDTYVLDFFIRSESLKKLSLDLPCVIVIPSWVSFPNLKKLSVSEIIFVDVNSIEKLFSCSSLDSLSIYRCKWRNLNNICISAPNLQFLDIDETINDDDINFDEVGFTFQDALSYDRRVYINGASLKTFMYNGELINDICILGDTTKLVERAQINICRLYEAAQDIIVPRGFKLLSAVANVKELILTDDFLKDLAAGDELFNTLPMFCNLSDLSVEWSLDPVSFRIFSMILRRSPRLRSLSFSEVYPVYH